MYYTSKYTPFIWYLAEHHELVREVKSKACVPLDPPFSSFTSSTDVQYWAKSMLERCATCHTGCGIVRNSTPGFLPTRLIDICSEEGNITLRWISSVDLSTSTAPYIALSYCWGGNQSFKLMASTVPSMKAGFGISTIPKTIQAAIYIARWFDIRYLWIDALCTIQDDDQDWTKESTTMTDVYQNSYLTRSIWCEGCRRWLFRL